MNKKGKGFIRFSIVVLAIFLILYLLFLSAQSSLNKRCVKLGHVKFTDGFVLNNEGREMMECDYDFIYETRCNNVTNKWGISHKLNCSWVLI